MLRKGRCPAQMQPNDDDPQNARTRHDPPPEKISKLSVNPSLSEMLYFANWNVKNRVTHEQVNLEYAGSHTPLRGRAKAGGRWRLWLEPGIKL